RRRGPWWRPEPPRSWDHAPLAPVCRVEDRLQDALVARAAADVAAHVVLDLVGGGRRVLGQERDGGHDHPRRAEATLERAVLDEGLLDRMQRIALGQALDGLHRRAARL